MIANVGDVESTSLIQRDTMRALELGLDRRTIVATKPRHAGAGYGGNDFGLGIDSSDQVVFHFDEVHVARFVESHFVGFIQFGVNGEPPVARVPFSTTASDSRDRMAVQVEPPHAVVRDFGNVERSIRPNFNAERLTDVDLVGHAHVTVILWLAGPGHGIDGRRNGR